MRNDEVVQVVVALVVIAVLMAAYIGLIVLGVTIAKRKNRSPHWMWFAIHPLGLMITLIVMACLPPLKRCPNCTQSTQLHARLCGICGYSYETRGVYSPPPVYVPPQRY
jgi:hypothetical protein